MSYRYEETANGTDLVIDGWEKGISDSPYAVQPNSAIQTAGQTGMTELSYGNITGVPGEFSVNFPLAASTRSGGVAFGVPQYKASNISGATVGSYYMLDSKSQIFQSNFSAGVITWTHKGDLDNPAISVTNAGGLVYFQGYLISFWLNKIFYSSDNGVTNTDWTATVDPTAQISSTNHFAIASQFNPSTMYFCNGSRVGTLIVNAGQTFDPTNAATYTFQARAVAVPSYDFTTCLAEINDLVMIGGGLNRVYMWDANNLNGSGVTSVVSNTLFLGDRYVQRIVVMNTNAYIFTGQPVLASSRGYIYVSNGSQIDVFKKMPDNLTQLGGTVSDIQAPFWQFGDAMYHRNKLYFGAVAISNVTGAIITGTGGVWCIDINSGALYRSGLMTAGESVLATIINPLDTYPAGTSTLGLSYWVGSSGSMNNTNNTMTTAARVITDKVPVGIFNSKKTFGQLELKLAVALASGETIDVTAITDVSPSGVSVGQMTSVDGMSRVFTPLSFQNSQWMQIKCVLNPTNTNPTYVRLREIRARE